MFHRCGLIASAFGMVLSVAAAAAAGEYGSAEDAVAMVKRAVAAVKAEGKDKVLAAVSAKDARFTDRDLYVFVWDMDGNTLAHGANAKMIGRNMAEAVDTDGKAFGKERLDFARTRTSFWSDYKYSNPTTRKIEPKTTYCEVADAAIYCVGVYKAP